MEEFQPIQSYVLDATSVFTARRPLEPFQIKYKFSYRDLYSIQNPYSPDIQHFVAPIGQEPLMETEVVIDLSQSDRVAHDILEVELKSWQIVGEGNLEEVIKFALDEAHDNIASMPPSHNVVYIHILVGAVRKFDFEEGHDSVDGDDSEETHDSVQFEENHDHDSEVEQSSMNVDEVRTIRADDSSTKFILRRRY